MSTKSGNKKSNTLFALFQINTMLPIVLAVLHFTCSSAKSINPKQTLHLSLAKQGKHSLRKELVTSENKNTTHVTSQLISEDKESQGVTSTLSSVVTSELTHGGVNVTSEGRVTSSSVNSSDVVGGNATSHLTVGGSDVKEKNIQVVEATTKTVGRLHSIFIVIRISCFSIMGLFYQDIYVFYLVLNIIASSVLREDAGF